jgi:diguanylate cyclase (GGDEF)-like protein/PAS domain S-box-containing protein
VQHSHDVVSVSDAKGRCVYVSPAVETLLGYAPDFAVFNDLSFIHPDDHQALVDTHREVMSGPGATAVVEYRMRAADGSWRTIESRVANRLDDPVVHGLVANSRDVTATRAAENALRRSEDRLHALLQRSTDFVMVWDADDTVTYYTPSVFRFIGDRIREQDGGELGITHPEDRDRVVETIARVRATVGSVETLRFRCRRFDGEYRWLETTLRNLLDDDDVRGIVLNAHDVTEQVEGGLALQEMNEALRRSSATMKAIVDNSPLAIYALDLDNKVSLWNPACERLYGVAAAETMGREVGCVPDYQRERFEWLCARIAEGQTFSGVESRTRRPDGKEIDVSVSAAPLLNEDGVHAGMLIVCADITDRKEAERALRRSEATFRGVVQHASDLILILDADARIRYASPAAHQVFGYPDAFAVGLDPLTLVHPDDVEWVAARLLDSLGTPGPTEPSEFRVRHVNGSWRVVEAIGHNLLDDPSVQGILVTVRDITERREAEVALRQSEQRFRALLQNLSDVVTVVDGEGNITYSSPAGQAIVGRGDVESEHQFMYVHPDDRERVNEEFARHLAAPPAEREPVVFQVRHADGSWRLVESVAVNLLDDPAVRGIVVTTRDVTERREAARSIAASDARYRAIVEDQTEFLCRVDENGRYTFVNDAFARYVDRPASEILGTSITDLFDQGDIERVADEIDPRNSEQRSIISEHRNVLPGGEVRWQQWTTRPIRDEHGTIVEYQSVGRDVTERKQATEWLAAQAKILELVAKGRPLSETLEALCQAVETQVHGARCAIHLVDDSGAGLECAAAPGMPPGFARVVGRVEIAPGMGVSASAVATGERVIADDVASDPRWLPYREQAFAQDIGAVWATPIRSASGGAVLGAFTIYEAEARGPLPQEAELVDQMMHLAAIAIDRKAFESRLAHQAHHDPLTGLPNRVLFIEFLTVALARARRRDSAVAVLFLDLDRFKFVNDSFGHDTGDELLTSLARRLQSVVRPGDTIARFGGDEFVVLCEDLDATASRLQAIEVAERLIAAVEQPFSCQGQPQFLSASIGIALSNGTDDRSEALVRDADAAMYRAKERGKGRWELFDEAMRQSVVQRVETENALHRAVERNEFRVYYQPVMSLERGVYVGAEALVRWEHPERGLIPPAEFITLAEETGLVVPLGRFVLEAACLQAAEWHERHGDPGFTISVNLSARQLSRPELVSEVAAALRASGAPPSMICFEITESVLMDDVEASLAAIRSLKALGVRLSIDDFGTGYSSLGYLKRLPVDAVKVDRSFVDGLGNDPEDSAIVAAVINLGHTLGLTVVAEGVETEQQLAELVALGCDEAQGFLFACPRPAADLAEVLETREWRPRCTWPSTGGRKHPAS